MTQSIDVLDDVLISPSATNQWRLRVIDFINRSKHRVIAVDQIMDVRAEVVEDGTLRIFCELAQGELLVEMVVPKDEWT